MYSAPTSFATPRREYAAHAATRLALQPLCSIAAPAATGVALQPPCSVRRTDPGGESAARSRALTVRSRRYRCCTSCPGGQPGVACTHADLLHVLPLPWQTAAKDSLEAPALTVAIRTNGVEHRQAAGYVQRCA